MLNPSSMRSFRSKSFRTIVIYILSSLFCSLMGKLIVTRMFFDYPVVILMMQSAATLFVVELCRVLGLIKVPAYSFEKGKQLLIPSILYTLSQWITVSSFEGIAMPNYDCIKRFTPLLIVLAVVLRKRQLKMDQNKILLIIGICFSSAIAVNLDLSMDRYSFLYGIFGAGFQAAAIVLFEDALQNYSANEVLYMHSFNSLVFYLLADIVQDEIRDSFVYLITAAHPSFIFNFIVCTITGIFYHWSTFACLESSGGINLQITSNVRSAIEIFYAFYSSFYLFYDVSPGLVNWVFLIITLIGARGFIGRHSEPEVKGPWITKA